MLLSNPFTQSCHNPVTIYKSSKISVFRDKFVDLLNFSLIISYGETADLVTFTEEIVMENFMFCEVCYVFALNLHPLF